MRPGLPGMLLLAWAASAAGAIEIDGRPDEPEWQQAQRFGDFLTVQPNTLAPAELKTEAWVLADESGLLVAFTCGYGAAAVPVRGQAPRDQQAADSVTLLVDFEGLGQTAYEFTVSISGSIRDAVVSRQNEFNPDWDAAWEQAVHDDGTRWTVELRLPWGIAAQGKAHDGRRRLGLLFARAAPGRAQRYALPALQFERPTLVADLLPVEVPAFGGARLDIFPYAAALHDQVNRSSDTRLGADLFWKPLPQHQLAAALNPDFGQVESDELVVNFSAIPTFFPDKRPFFTENFALFSTFNRAFYTRRIGAAPDAGPQGSSDIRGAARYSGTAGASDFGFVVAQDDAPGAEARDFRVLRLRQRATPALSFGWLGTQVVRPDLQRRAEVHLLDAQWVLAPGVTLQGEALRSDIRRPLAEPATPLSPAGRDSGASLRLQYLPGGAWEHILTAQHYGANFQIKDAGFLERNNLNALTIESARFFRDRAPSDPVQERAFEITVVAAANDRGERLPTSGDVTMDVLHRDSSGYAVELSVQGAGGADDLLTRGNGPVRTPAQRGLAVGYFNPETEFIHFTTEVTAVEGLFDGIGVGWTFAPILRVTEALTARLALEYRQAPDELIWQEQDNLLATFRYREAGFLAAMDWFPAAAHELRLLAQWSGGRGSQSGAYRPDAAGRLRRGADEVPDFSFSETALQLRYRYEPTPQSELYLVYSRGGELERAVADRSLGRLLRDGLATRDQSQILLKLRYHFSL